MINRADSSGQDNTEAAAIAAEVPALRFLNSPLGNRKSFRTAAAQGLAVSELKPPDKKAITEIMQLYQSLFDAKMIS